MPAKKFPPYPPRPHSTGQARISVSGRDVYLGRHGSAESHAEYAVLKSKWEAGEQIPARPKLPRSIGLTIADLIAAWLKADQRALNDGEVIRTIQACKPLERLFGATLANEFTTIRLKALQDAMVTGAWMTAKERSANGDWSRGYINAQLARVVRLIRWAESAGHVPAGTWHHLKTLPPIKKNDRRVRHTEPRKAADWQLQVVPTLKHLSPVVAAMVKLQHFAGMRPGEVVSMKQREIETAGPHGCWTYRPGQHKNTHRGQELVKLIGPQGQAALLPWYIPGEPDAYVFQTTRTRRAERCYTVESYARAVARACIRAGVVRWSPYCLRHAAKRAATRSHGLDAARAFLGQTSLGATNDYDREQDLHTAAQVAAKIG